MWTKIHSTKWAMAVKIKGAECNQNGRSWPQNIAHATSSLEEDDQKGGSPHSYTHLPNQILPAMYSDHETWHQQWKRRWKCTAQWNEALGFHHSRCAILETKDLKWAACPFAWLIVLWNHPKATNMPGWEWRSGRWTSRPARRNFSLQIRINDGGVFGRGPHVIWSTSECYCWCIKTNMKTVLNARKNIINCWMIWVIAQFQLKLVQA